jgi:hypothetical protein
MMRLLVPCRRAKQPKPAANQLFRYTVGPEPAGPGRTASQRRLQNGGEGLGCLSRGAGGRLRQVGRAGPGRLGGVEARDAGRGGGGAEGGVAAVGVIDEGRPVEPRPRPIPRPRPRPRRVRLPRARCGERRKTRGSPARDPSHGALLFRSTALAVAGHSRASHPRVFLGFPARPAPGAVNRAGPAGGYIRRARLGLPAVGCASVCARAGGAHGYTA